MNRSAARQYVTRIRQPPPVEDTATAYNQAADAYIAYADGDPDQLFAFKGPHAYADRRVWSVLEAKLHALRATGATSIHILDAGCGPGTWLRRLVLAARALGFTTITAVASISPRCRSRLPAAAPMRSGASPGWI
jgi:hypothetical protein